MRDDSHEPVDPARLREALDRLANTNAVIDMSILRPVLDMVPGTLEFAQELNETFARTLAQRMGALSQAAESGDHGQLAREAHGLKGAARQVGAVRLAAVCEALEVQAADAQQLLKVLNVEAQCAEAQLGVALSAACAEIEAST